MGRAIQVGDEVMIANPWWRKGQVTQCRICSVGNRAPLIMVKPLEGNPHARYIDLKDITWPQDLEWQPNP